MAQCLCLGVRHGMECTALFIPCRLHALMLTATGIAISACDSFCGARGGAVQIQDGFPTDRVLAKRGNLINLYDAKTRMQKGNTTDAYPVVLSIGDNKTYSFFFPYALPNVAVGDAVVVRRPCVICCVHHVTQVLLACRVTALGAACPIRTGFWRPCRPLPLGGLI